MPYFNSACFKQQLPCLTFCTYFHFLSPILWSVHLPLRSKCTVTVLWLGVIWEKSHEVIWSHGLYVRFFWHGQRRHSKFSFLPTDATVTFRVFSVMPLERFVCHTTIAYCLFNEKFQTFMFKQKKFIFLWFGKDYDLRCHMKSFRKH